MIQNIEYFFAHTFLIYAYMTDLIELFICMFNIFVVLITYEVLFVLPSIFFVVCCFYCNTLTILLSHI